MEDRELIYRIQRGQKELLNVVAEKYYDDIYRFCLYLTGQPEDSYDLTQETFYRLIRYVEHYRYKNLKGYLLTIARNLCTDYFRCQKEIPGNTAASISDGYEDSSLVELLEREYLTEQLQKLPTMQREAIVLYYYNNLRMKDVAKITGVGLSAVKSRIRQGTEKLRKIMREDGYER